MAVYNAKYGKDIEDVLKKDLEKYEFENIIIGGDFNIRTDSLGRWWEGGRYRKKSKDKIIENGE